MEEEQWRDFDEDEYSGGEDQEHEVYPKEYTSFEEFANDVDDDFEPRSSSDEDGSDDDDESSEEDQSGSDDSSHSDDDSDIQISEDEDQSLVVFDTLVQQEGYLPQDIFYCIFSFLPVRSLMQQMRLTCKTWYDLISLNREYWYDRIKHTREIISQKFTSNSELPLFPLYLPPMFECLLLECHLWRECPMCEDTRLIYKLNPTQVSICHQCVFNRPGIWKKLANAAQLLSISKTTLRNTRMNTNGRIWKLDMFFLIGKGDWRAGKQKWKQLKVEYLAQRDSKVKRRLREKKRWMKLLTQILTMSDHKFTEREIKMILEDHECDYRHSNHVIETDYCTVFAASPNFAREELAQSLLKQYLANGRSDQIIDRKVVNCHPEYILHCRVIDEVYGVRKRIIKYCHETYPDETTPDYDQQLLTSNSELNQVITQVFESGRFRQRSKYLYESLKTRLDEHIVRKVARRERWNNYDDLLQILSNGKYTLHDSNLPIICKEYIDRQIEKPIGSRGGKSYKKSVWKTKLLQSTQTSNLNTNVKAMIKALDRENQIRDLITDYGYEYGFMHITSYIRGFILHNHMTQRLSCVTDVALQIIDEIERVIREDDICRSRERSMFYSRIQFTKELMQLMAREDSEVSWGVKRKIYNSTPMSITRSIMKSKLMGKKHDNQVNRIITESNNRKKRKIRSEDEQQQQVPTAKRRKLSRKIRKHSRYGS